MINFNASTPCQYGVAVGRASAGVPARFVLAHPIGHRSPYTILYGDFALIFVDLRSASQP